MAGLPVALTLRPGRPLVLLLRMAFPASGVWDGVWSWLAARYTVASPDFSRAREPLDLAEPRAAFERVGRQALEVASALGFERARLFGWNGGTLMALAAAVAAPSRVEALVLVDPRDLLGEFTVYTLRKISAIP